MKSCVKHLQFTFLLFLLVGYSTVQYRSTTPGAVSHTLIGEKPTFVLANTPSDKGVPQIPKDKTDRIVLFAEMPVAAYRSSLSGGTAPLTTHEQTLTRSYGKKLQISHDQFLRQAQMSGIDLVVNYEFTYLLNGLALSVNRVRS